MYRVWAMDERGTAHLGASVHSLGLARAIVNQALRGELEPLKPTAEVWVNPFAETEPPPPEEPYRITGREYIYIVKWTKEWAGIGRALCPRFEFLWGTFLGKPHTNDARAMVRALCK